MRQRIRGGAKREHGPDRTAVYVDDALETHADAKNGDLASEVPDGIARDARVGGGVARTRRDDEGLDVELGQGCGGYGIVADDGDARTEQGELLVEIPRERVKVIDEQTIDRLGERGR